MRLRLSEAILLGQTLIASMKPHTLTGCAMGMALAAVGKPVPTDCPPPDEEAHYGELKREWPWLERESHFPCRCKYWGEETRPVLGVLTHLFDSHVMRSLWKSPEVWTLEQIADYVRSIEPAEPSEAVCGEGPNAIPERAELLKVKA